MENDSRTWAMFIHLSTLLGFISLGAGYLVPIVIWQMKKHEMPELDAHGKMVLNFLISMLIYVAACGILAMTVILAIVAIPLMIVLGIVGIVFPIIGGVKASEGELWQYPLILNLVK